MYHRKTPTYSSNDSADVVEWHGGAISEDPRLQLVRHHCDTTVSSIYTETVFGSKYSRDIDNDERYQEECHEFGSKERNGEFGSQAHRRHTEVQRHGPKEKSTGIGEVRAEVDLERKRHHGEHERDGEVESHGDEETVQDIRLGSHEWRSGVSKLCYRVYSAGTVQHSGRLTKNRRWNANMGQVSDEEFYSHYRPHGISRHGDDKGENQHVNKSDQSDSVRDRLVVWAKIVESVIDWVGDG